MIERKVTIAEIILIAGTRIALGAGIGVFAFQPTKQSTGNHVPHWSGDKAESGDPGSKAIA
jgi:hypothetical protein